MVKSEGNVLQLKVRLKALILKPNRKHTLLFLSAFPFRGRYSESVASI